MNKLINYSLFTVTSAISGSTLYILGINMYNDIILKKYPIYRIDRYECLINKGFYIGLFFGIFSCYIKEKVLNIFVNKKYYIK